MKTKHNPTRCKMAFGRPTAKREECPRCDELRDGAAACDEWMQGDRFGTVVGTGLPTLYRDRGGRQSISRPVRVKLDRSGRVRRFHFSNLFVIEGD